MDTTEIQNQQTTNTQVAAASDTQTNNNDILNLIETLDEAQLAKVADKVGARYKAENESLKSYKSRIEKEREEQKQKELEAQGKYEEAKKLLEEKEARLKRQIATSSLKDALIEKGGSPNLVKIAVDAYATQIQIGEDDRPINIGDIIAKLETESPELFTSSAVKGKFIPPSTSSSSTGSKMPFSEWSKLDSKTKIEIQKERGVDYNK